MSNIRFKGIFKNEEQLRKPSMPNESIKFEEPEDINTFLKNGLFISLPIICSSFIIAGQTILYVVENNPINKKDVIISIMVSSIILIWCPLVHEIIHAFFFPRKYLKEIYVSKDLTSMFVYCTAPVSRLRFITILLAPNMVLGVLPLFTVLLYKNILLPTMVLTIIITSFFSIIIGIGDYYNIYNTMSQVPKNAFIFNSGLHSYWYINNNKLNVNRSNSTKVLLVLFMSLGFALLFFENIICLLLFFVSVMVSTFMDDLFYSVFKWLNLVAIIFSYMLLYGLL